MWPIATDIARSVVCVSACLSVCVLGAWMSCVKMAEPIEMSFGELTQVALRNHVLDGSSDVLTGVALLRRICARQLMRNYARRMRLPCARARRMHS